MVAHSRADLGQWYIALSHKTTYHIRKANTSHVSEWGRQRGIVWPLESLLLALRLLALGLVVHVCTIIDGPRQWPENDYKVIRQSPWAHRVHNNLDRFFAGSTYVSIKFLSIIKTRDTFKFYTTFVERYLFFRKCRCGVTESTPPNSYQVQCECLIWCLDYYAIQWQRTSRAIKLQSTFSQCITPVPNFFYALGLLNS